MSVDPIQLIVQSRPQLGDVPGAGEGVTATQGQLRRAVEFDRGNLDDLSAMPGSPGYAAKMATLKSQALARGDPEEVRALQQETLVLPEQTQIQQIAIGDIPIPVVTPMKRVAIYYGKSDTYNVAIEESPDWDTIKMFKEQTEGGIQIILGMAEALGLKVQDKTGDWS